MSRLFRIDEKGLTVVLAHVEAVVITGSYAEIVMGSGIVYPVSVSDATFILTMINGNDGQV